MYRTVYLTALLVASLFAASCTGTSAVSNEMSFPVLGNAADCLEFGGTPVPKGTQELAVVEMEEGACRFDVVTGPDPLPYDPEAHRRSP